jgi:hypothetical protein
MGKSFVPYCLRLFWEKSKTSSPQAVSRRLPTAAARVQTRVGTWDFVMDKSGAGAGFLRELRFPLPIYIPSCHHALHNHLHYQPRLAQ